MRPSYIALGALLTVTLMPMRADSLEQVQLRVSPLRAFAPTNLFVQVHIEPNAENRVLEIIADSGGFYRSSQIPLEGEGGPGVVSVRFPNVPGGEYLVAAIVTDRSGRPIAQAHRDVSVLSPGQ